MAVHPVISERAETYATVYEDSDEVGVCGPDTLPPFRRADSLEYWAGGP